MPSLEVWPLVVVREHRAGFFSAFPACDPALVTYAGERERVLEDLRLYLSEVFARLPADDVRRFVLPEPAEARQVEVLVPRGDLPRSERMKTPLSVAVVELTASAGRWFLIPALGHVAFVPADAASEIDEHLRREILRVVSGRDWGGADYLDLLPTETFELERLAVALESSRAKPAAELELHKTREAARVLLTQVGRGLGPPRYPVLCRDLAGLRLLLQGSERPSLVLIGPEGSGKSGLMQAAAAGLGGRPERLVIATSGAELVAGQSYLGQLEERVTKVMKAAELLDAVLYFESLDDLFAGRQGGHEDVAGLMQRHVEQGRVRIVAEVTPENYDRLAHRHVGFFSHLRRFPVAPLTRDETIQVLEARSRAAHGKERPFLAAGAAALIVDSVERYDPYRALPGKAVALFEQLSAARQAQPTADGSLVLRDDDVYTGLAKVTGMPEFLVRDERGLQIRDVEQSLHRRVIGQERAARHVAETVCSIKARLQPADKPLAAFLFVGPTGVGKTELAKALARFLFGSEERMTRFDMSEYTDAFAAERLIRGSEREDGILTRRVRDQLFGVLLLDEIEKADPAVFDLLLQVLGEGRLSDARGRTAHFRNFIVIMTSNIGSERSRAATGFGATGIDDDSHYAAQVRARFRPEFVNRLDQIVCFERLSREEIAQVTELSVRRLAGRDGLEVRKIRLAASPLALAHLAEAGFSPAYGARGLRRHLEQALVAPVSSLIAGLGARADGCVVAVVAEPEANAADSTKSLLAEPALGQELARVVRTGLSFIAYRRGLGKSLRSSARVLDVSRLRRVAGRWLTLSAVTELRERQQELEAQLAETGSARRRRGFEVVLSQLAEESGRSRALLEPLDRAVSELLEIESLLISALFEGEEPGLLEAEARAAYARIQRGLVPVLLARSSEHESTLSIHELDDKKRLHELLLPLLATVRARGWEAQLHLDREERAAGDDWPSVKVRRWGKARSPAEYLDRYGELGAERPFDGVLVCVKGHAAGALLTLAQGRYRYQDGDTVGELWVQRVASRFALSDDDWRSAALNANVDRAVGRRQPLRWEFAESGRAVASGRADEAVADFDAVELFLRWEELCFEALVDASSEQG